MYKSLILSCHKTKFAFKMKRSSRDMGSATFPSSDVICSSKSNMGRVSSQSRQKSAFIPDPMEMDVLCGHDRNFSKHPGNIVYRQLIELHAMMYTSTDLSKQEKMDMTKYILSTLQDQYGSRFVRRGSNISAGNSSAPMGWEILSDMQARDKISHALRCHYKHQQTKSIAPAPTYAPSTTSISTAVSAIENTANNTFTNPCPQQLNYMNDFNQQLIAREAENISISRNYSDIQRDYSFQSTAGTAGLLHSPNHYNFDSAYSDDEDDMAKDLGSLFAGQSTEDMNTIYSFDYETTSTPSGATGAKRSDSTLSLDLLHDTFSPIKLRAVPGTKNNKKTTNNSEQES